ncbi:hypothetical protein B0H13DRAFT_1875090 [Mycena leptocephala]|nr:hypothetical protein B0H13DRAFT_1875090 [Mycena leptocephala]
MGVLGVPNSYMILAVEKHLLMRNRISQISARTTSGWWYNTFLNFAHWPREILKFQRTDSGKQLVTKTVQLVGGISDSSSPCRDTYTVNSVLIDTIFLPQFIFPSMLGLNEFDPNIVLHSKIRTTGLKFNLPNLSLVSPGRCRKYTVQNDFTIPGHNQKTPDVVFLLKASQILVQRQATTRNVRLASGVPSKAPKLSYFWVPTLRLSLERVRKHNPVIKLQHPPPQPLLPGKRPLPPLIEHRNYVFGALIEKLMHPTCDEGHTHAQIGRSPSGRCARDCERQSCAFPTYLMVHPNPDSNPAFIN